LCLRELSINIKKLKTFFGKKILVNTDLH
jgi:hypothetical protein